MKLEQIYESYYVNPLVAINSTSPADLLEAFEQAAYECPAIANIIAELNEGTLPINENELTEEQKIFFVGATKIVNAYKESTNADFNARFEKIIAEAISPAGLTAGKAPTASGTTAPATPTTGATSAGSKPGWLSKITGFLKGVGSTLGAFGQGFLQGFAGSEGKDKTGKDKPGWQSVTSKQDLSNIPDKGIAIAPERLKELGVDSEIINKLQRGEISGINVTDVNDNLISVSTIGGRLQIRKVPSYKGAIDATKATGKTVTTKPGKKELSDDPRNVRRRAQAAVKKKEREQQMNLFRKRGTSESQFQKTTRAVLREFNETSK
jgi:hypothetical protein